MVHRWRPHEPSRDQDASGSGLVLPSPLRVAAFCVGSGVVYVLLVRHRAASQFARHSAPANLLYHLWAVVGAASMGYAMAAALIFRGCLHRRARVASVHFRPLRYVAWTAGLAAVTAVAGLVMDDVMSSAQSPADRALRPEFTVIFALELALLLPGGVAFVAIAATARELPVDALLDTVVRELRALRAVAADVMSVFAGLLALIVLGFGLRRRALVAMGVESPAELVILWGLGAAAVLGLLASISSQSIEARADREIDRQHPLEGLDGDGLAGVVARRQALGAVLRPDRTGSSSLRQVVAVSSPLLTAFLSIALGR